MPTKAALKETPGPPPSQDLSNTSCASPSVSDCDNSKEIDDIDEVSVKEKKKDIGGDSFDLLFSGEKLSTDADGTVEKQKVIKQWIIYSI